MTKGYWNKIIVGATIVEIDFVDWVRMDCIKETLTDDMLWQLYRKPTVLLMGQQLMVDNACKLINIFWKYAIWSQWEKGAENVPTIVNKQAYIKVRRLEQCPYTWWCALIKHIANLIKNDAQGRRWWSLLKNSLAGNPQRKTILNDT